MRTWFSVVVLVVVLIAGALTVARWAPSPFGAADEAPAVSSSGSGGGGELVVYHSPNCGCCHEWVAYLQRHGFQTRTLAVEDVAKVKRDLDVPEALWSCHTAVWDGVVVEGHVPVEALRAYVADPPAGAAGLAVPGMPSGSPRMTGQLEGPLVVFAFGDEGFEAFMTLAELAP